MKLGPWPEQRPNSNRSRNKQVSLWLPPEQWQRLRLEAARRDVPITDLCRQLLLPALDALPEQPDAD